MDSPALTAIIDYWKDYHPNTVLQAYAELKRRNYSIPDRLTKRQNAFSAKYDHPDIDTYLNKFLTENKYGSYEEYSEQETGQIKKEKTGGIEPSYISDETNKNYKVVPFNPSDNVPSSLQRIIDSETANGWKYVNHQYSDKLKPGSAGCFGIGATPDSTIHVGFVVFEKK